ncbi:MAG: acyl-CoA carboxylase alpha chain [Actinomycetota bacterium]
MTTTTTTTTTVTTAGYRPITRLLIANRGEIAVRIARTARRLGITTVGVYSEPDRDALHTDAVDIAVALGGATPAESYLRADALVEAALSTGCDAVHPGYGFLAENAAFAEAVTEAGLIWVGPTPDQIRLLGDKVAAKRAAVEAGVPTTPIVEVVAGSVPADLAMPVLVKAAAGGGGRGMRIVRSGDELAAAIDEASREALSAFGDGTVFIEPYLERGRHIEVQIMGDAHGNVVHFHERDCSVQRRNQKVVEEAPAPGLDPTVRSKLHDGALALARHVGYRNAGTVEFLVGDGGVITFLEVNTRLQVEHPVTEAITGFDLVELQLRVAAGEPLSIRQDDIVVDGHAIEVRLVAEDPTADWIPSVGTITQFRVDAGRVDTGVRVGSEISPNYDSLVAKVVEHGSDRATVCRRLAAAMRTARITGVATNAASLAAVLVEPDFLAGAVPTAYLAEHPDVSRVSGPTDGDLLTHLLAAAVAEERQRRAADSVTGFAPSGWRNLATRGQRRSFEAVGSGDRAVHHVEYRLDDRPRSDVRYEFLVGPPPEAGPDGALGTDERRPVEVRLIRSTGPDDAIVLEHSGRRWVVDVVRDADVVHTHSTAGTVSFARVPQFVDHDETALGGGPVCPLPGTVIAVHVAVGDRVEEGRLLMVVEAMKMEHKIVATAAATVTEVRFGVGDRVDSGDLLVALDGE